MDGCSKHEARRRNIGARGGSGPLAERGAGSVHPDWATPVRESRHRVGEL